MQRDQDLDDQFFQEYAKVTALRANECARRHRRYHLLCLRRDSEEYGEGTEIINEAYLKVPGKYLDQYYSAS